MDHTSHGDNGWTEKPPTAKPTKPTEQPEQVAYLTGEQRTLTFEGAYAEVKQIAGGFWFAMKSGRPIKAGRGQYMVVTAVEREEVATPVRADWVVTAKVVITYTPLTAYGLDGVPTLEELTTITKQIVPQDDTNKGN